jgi:hypothetical protein
MALSNIGLKLVATGSLGPVFLFLKIQATKTTTGPHRGQLQLNCSSVATDHRSGLVAGLFAVWQPDF